VANKAIRPAPRPGLLLTGLAMLPLLIWVAALLLVVLGAGLGIIQWGERPGGRG
jgi:hypothetical protein